MTERNLDLQVRLEETREKTASGIVKFELDQILHHFSESIVSLRAQLTLADELVAAGRDEDAENIWRFQIVFLASALDFYMHEITKYGLCQIYDENWPRTDKYDNIQVDMKSVEEALKAGESSDWFLDYINGFYRTVTMISYDAVRDQLNLLGLNINSIADKAFYIQGGSEKTRDKLKRILNSLFNRRNVIAHQADREHGDAQIRSITKTVVVDFIDDIEKIVQAIDSETRSN